jgi:CHAT domain-containing protein
MCPIREFVLSRGIAPGSPMTIIPQGGLGLLPLHAAWDESQGSRRYFLDDFVVSYAPGFQVLKTSRERALAVPAARSALAVVNSTGDLPRSEDEGDVVAEVFGAGSATVLRRRDAVKGAVGQLVGGRSHLHFACHGVYDWQYALASGLLLAEEETLSLAEILQWQLPATRLAVLSACETGITDVRQAPDEYFGIPLAFLHAGAPAVVSTLWAVPDHSTALLMEQFYREQMTGSEPPAALRKAQLGLREVSAAEIGEHYLSYLRMNAESAQSAWLDLLRSRPESKPFSHPYFWAAFIMIGN